MAKSNTSDSSAASKLIGCWRVVAIDMIEGKSVSLIGGLPGEYVEFTQDGRYRVDLEERRPCESNYRVVPTEQENGLDVWIDGLEALLIRCIFRIMADELLICIAGNQKPRPTEIRRDDQKLWCVKTLKRADAPKKGRRAKAEPAPEYPSLIPAAFLKNDRKPSD